MVENETYEGWANRETWAVALHINNDQGWQTTVLDAVRAELKDNPEIQAYEIGDWLRENVEEVLDPDTYGDSMDLYPQLAVTIARDIGSLWRVNWTELGAAFLADVAESGE